MRVNVEKAVLRLIKPGNIIEFRGLNQSPVGIVAPAMIPTAKHSRCTTFLPGDSVRPMTTYVVECADFIILASNQEDRKARNVKRLVSTRLGKLGNMRQIDPSLCTVNNRSTR